MQSLHELDNNGCRTDIGSTFKFKSTFYQNILYH